MPVADPEERWVTLARIVRPQGRRGEVLADLHTDFPSLFTTSASLILVAPDQGRRPIVVESQWLPTGRSRGRVVLKLRGTDSISEAEMLTGYSVQMLSKERVTLEDQIWYVSDLVGCSLMDGDTILGTVADLHFPVTADGRRLEDSAPIFVVSSDTGGELLVPFANAFVRSIDIDAKRICMTLPLGLVDLNA